MPRMPVRAPQLAHRQKRAQPKSLGELRPGSFRESERCGFRNIMPFSPQRVKATPACEPLRIVQCDAVMTINTQWFSERLTERRMSQRQLAKLMGLDSSAVSLMFRGKRKMTIEEAAQIAVLLQSSTQEVLQAAGVQIQAEQLVPVVGFVKGDGTVTMSAEGTHDMVEAPPHMPPDCVAVQYRTAGTEREQWDGWLAFMAERQMTPDKALGCLALVAIKGSGLVITHVKRGYRRGTYNLLDSQGRAQENVELAWASPVYWLKTTA